MCPLGGRFYDGFSNGLAAHLPCHCLLIESDQGLILVDTGFGRHDIAKPYDRLSAFFIQLNRISFEARLTAAEQIEKLGFKTTDVRHIILTHLDFDHAGGLEDFPQATVHVMQTEMEAARQQKGFISSRRYRHKQWDNVKHWEFYSPKGDSWNGFEAVRNLNGLPPELLFIPLAGHTLGHAGVAIETGDKWLLHAGDAYFFRDEIRHLKRHCPPGTRFYQWLMEADRKQRFYNQLRLRELSLSNKNIEIFCSHDAIELKKLKTNV